jgi:hypothetical protein
MAAAAVGMEDSKQRKRGIIPGSSQLSVSCSHEILLCFYNPSGFSFPSFPHVEALVTFL